MTPPRPANIAFAAVCILFTVGMLALFAAARAQGLIPHSSPTLPVTD